MPRKPIGERVTAVEVEIKNLRNETVRSFKDVDRRLTSFDKSLQSLNDETGDLAKTISKVIGRLDAIDDSFKAFKKSFNGLTHAVNNQSSMSGRDKAAIVIALITAITSIIVTVASLFQG